MINPSINNELLCKSMRFWFLGVERNSVTLVESRWKTWNSWIMFDLRLFQQFSITCPPPDVKTREARIPHGCALKYCRGAWSKSSQCEWCAMLRHIAFSQYIYSNDISKAQDQAQANERIHLIQHDRAQRHRSHRGLAFRFSGCQLLW